MLRRLVVWYFVLALIGVASPPKAAPPNPGGPYTIRLRSRQFIPAEGVEASARSRLAARAAAGHFLVQLRDIPDPATLDTLGKSGLRLQNYIPDRGWFASMEGAALTRLASAPEIRWIGVIEVADKVPANLLQGHPLTYSVQPNGMLLLRMHYFDDVPEPTALAATEQHQGFVVGRDVLAHWLSIRLPASQVQALAAEDAVRWLSEAPPAPTPLNDSIRSRIRANDVQSPPYDLSGAGVIIGMWDCTLVWSHVDFLFPTRLTNWPGEHTACTGSDPTQNHATHVAGILAGSGANSEAQGGLPNQWKGIAPGARIVAYDFYSPTLEMPSAITTYGIDLSQNSWGYPPTPDVDCQLVYGNYDSSAHDYDNIVMGSAGKRIPVVFAAGNSQGACGTWNSITPPATAKNVIAVGMTDSQDDSLVSPSSIGPTDDGRIKPDVVAPGAHSDAGGIKSTQPGNTYGREYGTSMAAPAVSGMLALMLQQYRISTRSPSANPLPSTLKAMAIHGAVDLGNPGPDYRFGWGRVDARNSVDLVRRIKYREDSVSNGQVTRNLVPVLGCEPTLKATLVWDDPAGTNNALVAYVNDLDLTLISPNGTVYYPWQLDPGFPANPATTGPSGDHRNNAEQVLVANPAAGNWTVVVTGTSVPVSTHQTYSLVSEAFPTAPSLGSLSPANTQPGAQIVLRGDNFGCAQGPSVLTFGGAVTVTVPAGSWTNEAITVTVPANAQTGNVAVTSPAGTSNLLYLRIVRSLYLPSLMNNYPPVYHWIDASDGVRVADGDEVTTSVALPFAFKFYGSTYTSARVSSNGFVGFGSLADAYYQNSCLPAATLPNNAIYAFWADLDATNTITGTPPGGIWYKPLGTSAVIEWQNVPRYGTIDLETFEIILSADNSIIIQYQSVTNFNDVTVGIENGAGDSAIQSYCHRSSPPTEVGTAPADGGLLYYSSP